MQYVDQVNNKRYETNDKKLFGDIKVGDYAFIKLMNETSPATVKRLWKLKQFGEEGGVFFADFEEVLVFKPISLKQFVSLDLFVLNMNLLNKCNKTTKRLSFINLALTNENVFDSLLKNPVLLEEYIKKDEHYRKMVKLDSLENAIPNSIDVQFYKEGDSWLIADTAFVGDDLRDNYDSSQYIKYENYEKKGSNSAKDQMYSFLNSSERDSSSFLGLGLWDLFCGEVPDQAAGGKKRKTTNKRNEFTEFCKSNGVSSAADQYESGIRSMESELEVNVDSEYDSDKCEALLVRIKEYVKKLDKDQIGNRRNWASYVEMYKKYKESIADSSKDDSPDEEKAANILYDYAFAKHCGYNKIFYGTPGCGKSYYVENDVLTLEEIDINSVVRTTFYQDYANTDFIGQVLPKVEGDDVKYEFNPGPFTLALKCAIDNPDEKAALIIEELNRGNAPSIFGDIFQLLDRDKGTSRYKITNVNIQKYLNENSVYDLDYIKIPSNLYIFATMNTSDQNVFTLDTAFKRRWKSEKLTNDFLGKDTIGNKYVPGLKNVKWRTFVEKINKFIIDHATSLSAEDKQLGKYFVESELLLDDPDDITNEKTEEFAYKVFEYLWTDVAKFNRKDWFLGDIKSLDILIYKYTNHQNVFVSELADYLPTYVEVDSEDDDGEKI